jgi:alpha-beta hydrolase superfamily lysophospholipase|nr:alpha/beta hydrolase [Kofleriaceae bacterium]
MRAVAAWLPVLVVATACAHAPDLPLRPDPAPPAESTVDTFVARDGTKLLSRHWPAKADVRAVVVIMHGLKDYSARYAHFAHRLAEVGYSVYAFDMRGHGRSAGPRVAPADWLDYVDDLDRFLTDVEKREPGKHVYLFGHSMGGAVAALTAERHAPKLAGLMLSGPALVADAPPLKIAGAMFADAATPDAPALGLDNHDFSSDPAAADAMDKDDLISQPAAPAHTAAGLLRGMAAIWDGVGALTMPLLALHGSADKLTAPWGSRALVDAAPGPDKTLKIYDNANHDLLHEPDGRGDEVEKDLVAWLDAHEGGQPFAAGEPYEKRLAGRPRGWTQAVEAAIGIGGGGGGDTSFAGRLAVEVARPEPVGWHGALIAERLAGATVIALQPVGVAARVRGVVLGVSGGLGFADGAAASATVSVGGWLEVPLGAVHAGVQGEVEDPIAGTRTNLSALSVSVRYGEDHPYWPRTHAGVGPMLTGGLLHADPDGPPSATAWFVLLGLELYGAD